MNGKRAKRLRRMAYGDLSLRVRRYVRSPSGQIKCAGARRRYQQLKKEGEKK